MEDSHFSDMAMIRDHFPDAVDIERVQQMDFTECVYINPPARRKGDVPGSVNVETKEIRTIIELKELEPETGIYAGMSPITHRVYVYVDLLIYMP